MAQSGLGGLLVCRKIRTMTATRIVFHAVHNLPARVLSELAPVVPMETEFSQFTRDLRRLFAVKSKAKPTFQPLRPFPIIEGPGFATSATLSQSAIRNYIAVRPNQSATTPSCFRYAVRSGSRALNLSFRLNLNFSLFS
jgi:hypothetical protein